MAIRFAQIASAVTLIVAAASLCPIEAANKTEIGVNIGRSQREFDYFKLALQWPATYCRRTSHCCSSNACCRGPFINPIAQGKDAHWIPICKWWMDYGLTTMMEPGRPVAHGKSLMKKRSQHCLML